MTLTHKPSVDAVVECRCSSWIFWTISTMNNQGISPGIVEFMLMKTLSR